MEKELSIAAILKDKPNAKLWSPMFGECEVRHINDDIDNSISVVSTYSINSYEFIKDGRFSEKGEMCLFPSKEMRSWEKFAWKKGDVLTTKTKSLTVVFEHFNATYESFVAKYSFCSYQEKNEDDAWNKEGENSYKTLCFSKVSDDEAKEFIKKIEEHYGGKLNLSTLQIEQPKPEFKDGDIVAFGESFAICKKIEGDILYFYACIDDSWGLLLSDSVDTSLEYRLATDSEKQQLFDALAKEGKVWNSETKQIEDLPKKCEFKPMDWCLMRYKGRYNNRGWELCQYAYTEHRVSVYGDKTRDYYHAVGGEIYSECLPYNENTQHLLGTNQELKGSKE